ILRTPRDDGSADVAMAAGGPGRCRRLRDAGERVRGGAVATPEPTESGGSSKGGSRTPGPASTPAPSVWSTPKAAVDGGYGVHVSGADRVRLRAGSSDGPVRGNVVRETGLRKPKFGEGIYVGNARSNWCRYCACEPDRSDRNVVEGNDIAGTTAENVDVKEGTTGGVLRDNKLSGDGAVRDR